MADTPPDSFLREIDEELRQDKLRDLWKRYGALVIGAAVLLVAVVAGYQGWRAWDRSTRLAMGDRYMAADQLAATDQAEQARKAFLDLARDAGSGYELLAELRAAALTAEVDGPQAAAAAYWEIADERGRDTPYGGLATVLGSYHALDGGDAATLRRRLEPLAAADSPWRHSAREVLGFLAVREGDREAALGHFRALSEDATAPQGSRTRAAEMVAKLGGAAETAADATPGGSG